MILKNLQEYIHLFDLSNKKKLHKNPFIEFDLSNYDSLDVEKLVSFYKTTIDLNQILHDSEEVYFLDNFNNGLFN